jgi:hypothetical protein
MKIMLLILGQATRKTLIGSTYWFDRKNSNQKTDSSSNATGSDRANSTDWLSCRR